MIKIFLIVLFLFHPVLASADLGSGYLFREKGTRYLNEVKNLFNDGRFFDAEIYALQGEISVNLFGPTSTPILEKFQILRAMSLWKLGDTTRALEILENVKNKFYYHWILLNQGHVAEWDQWTKETSLSTEANEYRLKQLQAESLPQKSALLTGLMSAVLPGLGHARLGLWQDAALTLALNALFVGATIDFARNNQPFAAIAAGGVGSFFYIGGIVSAVKLTEASNNSLKEKFLNESALKIFPELRFEF
jgi:hypothetical protein